MIHEGSRVKLRPGSRLGRAHPELAGAGGVVGSVVREPLWQKLDVRTLERARDVRMHVRFPDLNLVAMNVPAGDVEVVDRLNPELDSELTITL